MKQAFVVGIAGGSGSGKSTFSNRLKNEFTNDIALISCDNYYLPHSEMSLEQRNSLNYDSPEAFDFPLMISQIRRLKNRQSVVSPVYDFSLHTRSSKSLEIEARPVIIIDGILIFADPRLRELMDIKIYVETDADERILRRVTRDISERGRTIESVIQQYLSTVKPMHNKYVEPTKSFADIIINGGKNETSFDIIRTKIKSVLEGEKQDECLTATHY